MARNHMVFRVFSLISIFGVVVTSLLGCSSTEPNLRKADKLDIQYKAPSSSFSGGNATEKKEPKMTSLEHESSGDLQLRTGNLDMAYMQYEKALRVNPDNVRVRYKKAVLLVTAGMNVEAIKEFQEVLKREPEHALAYEGLGKAYFQMEKYDLAEKNFRRGLELSPNLWQPHNYLGIIYDHRGRHDRAIHEFEAAIRLKPDEGLLYNNLGVSYSLAGDYKEALDAFNRGQRRNYFSSKFYNNLGLVLSKLGRDQEALDAFKRAGDQAQAYNNLGCVYLEAGEFEKAISYFEKAIEARPTFYAKASDNLEKAKIMRSRGASLESNVKIPSKSQAEQPAVSLEEKRQQREEASSFEVQSKSAKEAGLNLEQSVREENSHIQSEPNTQAEKTFIERRMVGQNADRKEKEIASEKTPNVQVSLASVQTEENIGNEEKESLKSIAVKEEEKPVVEQAKELHLSLQTEEDRIDSLLESWRRAWENKALDEYIAYYHPAFEKDGKDLNAWKNYKKKLNERYRHISVKVSEPKVIIERDKDTAWAYFNQRYRSETLRLEGYKLLEFRKKGDSWKIFREHSFKEKPGQ